MQLLVPGNNLNFFLFSQGVGLVTGVSGASAAQNGVFHVFDAILGVRHEGWTILE